MDLGIAGRRAIVCAASKGLGRGCAHALASEGVEVWITARTASTLEETAAAIRSDTGARVTAVPGDITTPEGRAAVLAACPDPDILVNNAGGPPPGDFREWTLDDWNAALNANMLTAIELIRATVDGMMEREFGRVVNITSAAVKSPIDILGLSNGARAGLTGFVAGVARKTVRRNVTINGLLPGPFDTDRLNGTFASPRQGHRPPRGRAQVGRGGGQPGRPLRHRGGVRARLRVPVQRPRGLHHRAEPAHGRRLVSGHPVTPRRPWSGRKEVGAGFPDRSSKPDRARGSRNPNPIPLFSFGRRFLPRHPVGKRGWSRISGSVERTGRGS